MSLRGRLARLARLESRSAGTEDVVFITTGVPRHDREIGPVVAFTRGGCIARAPGEPEEAFRARVAAGMPETAP